jgi:hypothetical protein
MSLSKTPDLGNCYEKSKGHPFEAIFGTSMPPVQPKSGMVVILISLLYIVLDRKPICP